MSKIDVEESLLNFLIFGFLLSLLLIVLAWNLKSPNAKIINGELIIIDNASYKCTKTNELK